MNQTTFEANSKPAHLGVILGSVLALAFSIRVCVRFAFGEDYFWTNSYSTYYSLAQNIVAGKGFCLGSTCAYLPPLYPIFLTLPILSGKSYHLIVVLQALLGAGTALCAFLIGRRIFGAYVGLLACAITSFYPYYVVHDTALQETGLITFGTALAVWLMLRAGSTNRDIDWLLVGLAVGAMPLIRASAAPAVGIALLWCGVCAASGRFSEGLRKGMLLLIGVAAVSGPWLVRTYLVTGAPVLSSQTGNALWMGNNPDTFSSYPLGSIDRSRDQALQNLSNTDWADLRRLGNDEIARSRWFTNRALTFIRENPLAVLRGMLLKLGAGFSWGLNPVREPLAQAVYSISYIPVALLGVLGMCLARRKREVVLIGMLFIAFIGVTAVFWAHTSHRSYLDVYLIVLAASVVQRLWIFRNSRRGTITLRSGPNTLPISQR